jgi:hypothetical protein
LKQKRCLENSRAEKQAENEPEPAERWKSNEIPKFITGETKFDDEFIAKGGIDSLLTSLRHTMLFHSKETMLKICSNVSSSDELMDSFPMNLCAFC